MNNLPQESPICLINPERKNSLDYINQFVIKKEQKVMICDQNSLKNLQKNEENRQNGQNLEIKNSNLFQNEKQSLNKLDNSNSSTNSTNLQNTKSAKIFIFWENYNDKMNLTTKPLWLEKWEIRQKIGNIEILEID